MGRLAIAELGEFLDRMKVELREQPARSDVQTLALTMAPYFEPYASRLRAAAGMFPMREFLSSDGRSNPPRDDAFDCAVERFILGAEAALAALETGG